jgi:hypothetical protein
MIEMRGKHCDNERVSSICDFVTQQTRPFRAGADEIETDDVVA